MKIFSKYKTLFLPALCIIILNTTGKGCFAITDTEEETPFTGAQSIAPGELKTMENRSYDEGITVKKIEIEGNHLVRSKEILNTISTKEGSKFDRNALQKDLKTIYDMGYFTESLKVVPKVSSKGVVLKIKVEENVPVKGFTITGNNVIESSELAAIINSQAGLPQNINSLNKSIENIEKYYADKGYILARVKKVYDDPDGTINLEVNEGIIDDIKISGNSRTKEFVISRNITMEPDTVYNENQLRGDLSRIYGTQSFADVRRVISASSNDADKYQLTIEVDEKRTGAISLGGGVDTAQGLFGTVGFTDNNFRGLGQEVSLSFMTAGNILLNDSDTLNMPGLQFEAKFLEPRFKQTLNSLEVSAYGRNFASYQVPLAVERRIGSEIEVARPFKKIPHLAGSVSMGVESVDIREGDFDEISNIFASNAIDISRRAEQLDGGTYITLGPSLVYDTRNNILNPTEGAYASIGIKEAVSVSGDAGSYGKIKASLRRFYPVGEKSTFMMGGKVGVKGLGDLPEFAAFRLGGPSSIRGYREGNVGSGKGYMMTTAEFRTPIPYMEKITDVKFFNNIRMAFFLDAGTLFGETLTSSLYNRPGYGIAAGSGLRLMVPGIGPICIDYGIPLTNVGAGNKKGGRFTFGFGDYY